MPLRFGPLEIFLILMVIMILFGVGRLPEVGSGLGKGIREFRRGITGREDQDENSPETDSS